MNEYWVKAIGTVVFGGGYFGAVWLGLGEITADIFLSFLSLVWLGKPIATGLGKMFKP